MKSNAKQARLNFRLANDLKALIEEAATLTGQSVSDYAVSNLVRISQEVLEQRRATVLSARDRQAFMALLEDANARPTQALARAARRYKRQIG
jgi:uncharacterized protein (DUF1778 family)